MNKQRRKELERIKEELQTLLSDLEIAKDEEQEYYDNMPESFQNGERGEKAESAISALECAYDNITECIENIDEALEA